MIGLLGIIFTLNLLASWSACFTKQTPPFMGTRIAFIIGAQITNLSILYIIFWVLR